MLKRLLFIAILFWSNSVLATSDQLSVFIKSIPNDIDPAKLMDANSMMVSNQIFEGLFEYDDANSVKPLLAKSYSISPDGLTYKFILRDDKMFSNGVKLTSGIVIDSIHRTGSLLGVSGAWALGTVCGYDEFVRRKNNYISGIKKVDDQTIKITLVKPFYQFIQILANPLMAVSLSNSDELFGTGPYVMDHKEANKLYLTKNQRYSGSVLFPSVVFVKSSGDFNLITDKEISENFDILPIPYEQKTRFENNRDFYIYNYEYIHLAVVYLNTVRGPLSDLNNRRAFVDAFIASFDKHIDNTYLFERGLAFTWGIFSDFYSSRPVIKNTKFKNLTQLKGIYSSAMNSDFSEKVAGNISRDMSVMNIELKLEKYPIDKFINKIKKMDFDVAYMAYLPDYIDPDAIFYPMLYSNQQYNFSGYSNKIVDEYLDQAREETSDQKRYLIYRKILQIIKRDAPIYFAGTTRGLSLVRKGLAKPRFNALGYYHIKLKNIKKEG